MFGIPYSWHKWFYENNENKEVKKSLDAKV